jgi:hypothetical protein
MRRARGPIFAAGLLGLFGGGVLGAQGCVSTCRDAPRAVETAEYVVESAPDGLEWLIGAELVVDADAETVVLRYTRDSATYEVHYHRDPDF